MKNEGLEAITSPVNTELKNGTQFYTYTKEDVEIIEKELKAKDNLVSMCENLAKLVGLKEKDYVELETLIAKKFKALEFINKRFGSFILTMIEDDLRTSKEERELLKEVLK